MNGERDEARVRDERRIARFDLTGVAPNAEIVLEDPLDLLDPTGAQPDTETVLEDPLDWVGWDALDRAELVKEHATDPGMTSEELHEIRGLTNPRTARF